MRRVEIIVDANSIYARCFFASQKKGPDGDYRQVFMRSLFSLMSPTPDRIVERMTHLVLCWDGQSKNDKGRSHKPEGYEEGLEVVKSWCVAVFGQAGNVTSPIEADDACATYARRADLNPECDIAYVVSGDKDLMQLATKKVNYYCLNAASVIPISRICEKWGVRNPAEIAVALAVLGDSQDNIPGVWKYGPSKFAKIMESAPDGSLADLADHVSNCIPADQQTNFIDSLDLTLLHRDLDLPMIEAASVVPLQDVQELDEWQWLVQVLLGFEGSQRQLDCSEIVADY